MSHPHAPHAHPHAHIKPRLSWPSIDVLAMSDDWGSRVRFNLRNWVALPWQNRMLAAIGHSIHWVHLFTAQPIFFRTVIRRYLDRRLSVSQRYTAAITDLNLAGGLFGPRVCEAIGAGRVFRLAALGQSYTLALHANELNPEEGMWALSLRNEAGERLYHVTFGFWKPHELFIGSIQGPRKSETVEPEVVMKALTNAAERLRPPHLMVYAMRSLSVHWGITQLVGIDPANHVKSRWNRHAKELMFDYRTFWTEAGAERLPSGNWDVKVDMPERPLETIEQRKRSQYRKRYALLAALKEEMLRSLAEPGEALPAAAGSDLTAKG